MRKRFKDRYRIETTRLRDYDYASPGWYFITICTKNRACLFGEVRNGMVGLSEVGVVVAEEWQKTESVRPYVRLDEWVVMPNHLHGIIGITTETPAVETPRRGVSTERRSLDKKQWKSHSLGAIIGQFKSVCTKRIRKAGFDDFAWQSRFYDHIIRGERALQAIRRYIADNSLKWHLDKNHPANL